MRPVGVVQQDRASIWSTPACLVPMIVMAAMFLAGIACGVSAGSSVFNREFSGLIYTVGVSFGPIKSLIQLKENEQCVKSS